MVLFTALIWAGVSGCAASEQSAGNAQIEDSSAADAERARLESLYWERINASRTRYVQAEVDFMTDMIVHHAQALIMARLAPTNNASDRIQRLSARIINAQQDEIALMQKWLRDRNKPVPLVDFDGIVMKVVTENPDGTISGDEAGQSHSAGGAHGGSPVSRHNHDMLGMLTQDQLEELASVRGNRFDRIFLMYMIQHHEGAVHMVYELFAADGAGNDEEAYRLASDIYAEQVTEIEMMKLMLRDMGEQPPASILPNHNH